MHLHRQTYLPTQTEHEQIEQSILSFPRRNRPETNLRDWTIFKLASLTGLRINELLNIQLKDIDWERRKITIPAEQSKNKHEGFVWINRFLLRILQDYIQRFKPTVYLFFSLSNNRKKQEVIGLKPCGWGFNWRKYLDHAGLGEIKYVDKRGCKRRKILYHTASRTYFINQVFKANSGRNIVEISRVTRHRSIQCLYDYYLRFNDLNLWQECVGGLK